MSESDKFLLGLKESLERLPLMPVRSFVRLQTFFRSVRSFSSSPISHTTSPTHKHGGHIHVSDIILAQFNLVRKCKILLQTSPDESDAAHAGRNLHSKQGGIYFCFFILFVLRFFRWQLYT